MLAAGNPVTSVRAFQGCFPDWWHSGFRVSRIRLQGTARSVRPEPGSRFLQSLSGRAGRGCPARPRRRWSQRPQGKEPAPLRRPTLVPGAAVGCARSSIPHEAVRSSCPRFPVTRPRPGRSGLLRRGDPGRRWDRGRNPGLWPQPTGLPCASPPVLM